MRNDEALGLQKSREGKEEMPKMKFTLDRHEYVMTAWPEAASGPGWNNSFLCVLLYNSAGGTYRVESIQRDEMTDEEHWLFASALAASSSLTCAVKQRFQKKT